MKQGAFGIVIYKNRILLEQLPSWVDENPYCWQLPGGVVDEGETLEDAVVREVKEETGINCKVLQKIDYIKTDDYELYFFSCSYVGGEILPQRTEVLDVRWFTKEEALQQKLAYDIRERFIQHF